MSAPRCAGCAHPDHGHTSTGCAVTDVTGPPSGDGKPVGDTFEHVGRNTKPCGCITYLPPTQLTLLEGGGR